MDLGGTWRAIEADDELRRRFPEPELDDEDWEPVPVPGHWRSQAAFASSDGPVLYRRGFDAPGPSRGRRAWLRLAGLFYQGDVWLDGGYLGDTEGYFVPHSFEVTDRLAERGEHVLAVEVACTPASDRRAKRNLTGIFGHWDCIDPEWNPGGIWAPVTIEETGPVRITSLRVVCQEANLDQATLDLEAELDTLEATTANVVTTVAGVGQAGAGQAGAGQAGAGQAGAVVAERATDETLAAGRNRVHWRVTVDRPALWWPHALGAQELHTVTVTVSTAEGSSDRRRLTTGLRQVRMRHFVASINGERLFLKGTNCGPTRRALGEATPADLAGDVTLARQAGLDLLRVHAHISRAELYEAADRQGMLIWQDLPLQWGYGGVRRQAVRQARHAVSLLGHHPSVAVWCGHNEPFALDRPPGAGVDRSTTARFVAGQVLPSRNKTTLDRSVRRALEKADGSRPVVAHSGVLPHPAGGTDSHLYYGWYHGRERDFPAALARFPVLARFVSEFGAQAVPDSADFAEPGRWPDLDWSRLIAHHALQRDLLDRRVTPAGLGSFDEWRRATQAYQARVVRYHVETLRRLKYRPTGGFCQFLLADAQPAISWSVLDHQRRPKAAFHALADACAPVVVVADRPAARYAPGDIVHLDVHVVNDLRTPIVDATTTATLCWPGGRRTWRWAGRVEADAVAKVGRVEMALPSEIAPLTPGATIAPLTFDLSLRWPSAHTAGARRGPGSESPAGVDVGHVVNRYVAGIEERERPSSGGSRHGPAVGWRRRRRR